MYVCIQVYILESPLLSLSWKITVVKFTLLSLKICCGNSFGPLQRTALKTLFFRVMLLRFFLQIQVADFFYYLGTCECFAFTWGRSLYIGLKDILYANYLVVCQSTSSFSELSWRSYIYIWHIGKSFSLWMFIARFWSQYISDYYGF